MSRYKETWNAADVQCPFFLGENCKEKNLVCEGWGDRMKVTLGFSTFRDKDSYMGKHCAGDYRRCKLFKMTMEKYEWD